MNRYTLIRQLNVVYALILVTFPWVVMSGMRKDWYAGLGFWRTYDLWLLPLLAVTGVALALCVNRRWLPRRAANKPYLAAFLLALLYSYAGLFLVHHAPNLAETQAALAQNSTAWTAFLYVVPAPLMWLAWMWPVALVMLLIATPVAGFLMRFVYARRDYLPEEV